MTTEHTDWEAELAAIAAAEEASALLTQNFSPHDDLAHTQAGMGHYFAEANRHRLRSVPEDGRWLFWNGSHWVPDTLGLTLQRLKQWLYERYQIALEALPAVEAEAQKRWPDPEDHSKRGKFIENSQPMQTVKRLRALLSRGGVQGILSLATSEPAIRVSVAQLDTHKHLLPTPMGTVDLRTGKLLEAQREHLMTRCAVPSYVPGARAPRWEQFIAEVTEGDEELADYLQRLAGYFLTGEVREHVLVLLHGPGRNGKDVFADAISFVLGDLAAKAAPRLLIQTKHEEHPTEIADLQGLRLAVHSEIEQGAHIKQSQMKHLTGSSTLKGRFMRSDFVEFPNTAKHLMLTNYLPDVRGDDLATQERIKVVPFRRYFSPEDQDTQLADKLKEEAAGILTWMVQGAVAYYSEGLTREPEAVRLATADYFRDQDPGGAFAEECLDFTGSPSDWVSNPHLDLLAQAWARQQAEGETAAHLAERVKATRSPKLLREGATKTAPRLVGDQFPGKRTARGWQGVKPAEGWDMAPLELVKDIDAGQRF